ncbi:MAG TPA: hypothetical protein VLJ79_12580, partial [Candidatus Binatia bacterium]|nr:hypothetical protein [Candidatus Binatia bacterium]
CPFILKRQVLYKKPKARWLSTRSAAGSDLFESAVWPTQARGDVGDGKFSKRLLGQFPVSEDEVESGQGAPVVPEGTED